MSFKKQVANSPLPPNSSPRTFFSFTTAIMADNKAIVLVGLYSMFPPDAFIGNPNNGTRLYNSELFISCV